LNAKKYDAVFKEFVVRVLALEPIGGSLLKARKNVPSFWR
jgi:hypothetical protein